MVTPKQFFLRVVNGKEFLVGLNDVCWIQRIISFNINHSGKVLFVFFPLIIEYKGNATTIEVFIWCRRR